MTSVNLEEHNIILQELGGKYPRYALYVPEDFYNQYKNYITLKQLGGRYDINLPNGPTYTYPNFKIPLLKETLQRIILGDLPSIDDLKGPEIMQMNTAEILDMPPRIEYMEKPPMIEAIATINTDQQQLTNKDLQIIGDLSQRIAKKNNPKKVVAPGKIIKRMANEKFSIIKDIKVDVYNPIIATEQGELSSIELQSQTTYAKAPSIYDVLEQDKGEADYVYEVRLKYYTRCLEMKLTTDMANMYSRSKINKIFNNNGYNQYIENQLIILFGEK